jgi:two-component system sensor histidine kinase MprB
MARLTGAAEEIARTQDLDLPVAVSGRDEVGRMGRAFAAPAVASGRWWRTRPTSCVPR